MLGDEVEDHLAADGNGAEDPHRAPEVDDVVLGRERIAAIGLDGRIRG
jgi:hypothetical protein